MTPAKHNSSGSPVAIIGMGCIFPESRNLKEYWHLLFNGIDAIGPIPETSHWKLSDYFDPDPARPDHTYCKRGGFIPDIAFDPLSYGIPPNNLQATDTSQLLGLEVARMALEDAGYAPGHAMLQEKKVNVILGVTGTQELVISLGARLGHPFWKQALEEAGIPPEICQDVMKRIDASYVQWQENSFPGLLGNVVAGRIANRLNLSGTNAVSDAACASSLSAIHTAVMELQAGRCDMSITGGVDTLNDIFMHMCFSKTGVLSHTSDAKPFSKDADGTVLGEGIGMLVLKRLADARKDNDRIYAVIKGIGTASDGRTSAVYAPESAGQLRALTDAYHRAGVDPATVDLIEAHGTGTRVGDKVEFTALKQCFKTTGRSQATAIGSVKSMIGHTKAAAGAAGIIKTALALHNKVLPPTLKAGEPDPDLNITDSAFYLNAQAKPWVPAKGAAVPRRSGISAFGFGGSNFHALLEEVTPEKSHVSWDGSVQIFAFSAPDTQALCRQITSTLAALSGFDRDKNPAAHFQAVAWQAGLSREAFSPDHPRRLLLIATREDDVQALLDNALHTAQGRQDPKAPIFMGEGPAPGKLGFLFPGQGSQYPGMARELMSLFPEGVQALDLAESATAEETSGEGSAGSDSLTRAIYPLPDYALDKKTAEEKLRQTQVAQPAIGAVSMALTDILKRFEVLPDITCGHSYGELSALFAAGWMNKQDFLSLSTARGRFMAQAGKQGKESGSMLAVQAPMDAITALMEEEGLDLVLANKNSPTQGVLSGSTEEIDRARKCCRRRKMRAVKLPVAAAFHSALVAEAATPFHTLVETKKIRATRTAVMSNTTGSGYPETETAIKALLGDQLVHPVNFTDNIRAMADNGVSSFIEVGPKTVLSGLVKAILKGQPALVQAMDDPGSKHSGLFGLAQVLCRIAARGHGINLKEWEEPAAEPVLPKMSVILNGANLGPDPAIRPAPRASDAPALLSGAGGTQQPASPEATVTQNPPKQGLDMTPHPDFMRSSRKTIDQTTDTGQNRTEHAQEEQYRQTSVTAPAGALQGANAHLVQKGLEAMQQLQAQTARAHEKFLETQAQASRTLAEIMAQTRGEMPVRTVVPEPARTTAVPAQPVAPRPVHPEPVPEPPVAVPAPELQTAAPAAPAAPPAKQPEAPAADAPGTGVQTVLFDIVSRLTGFPVEMLEPQMDIESDLGIDSIKKVEIISELEKELPGSQGLSSDHLTTVRTLEDICAALGGQAQAASAPQSESAGNQAAPQATSGNTMESGSDVMAVLVNIISELTGFPQEMLEPEMNLESDLGIDSIKRVEILSRLEQELPNLKAISPDDMGSLKSLGDIVSFLKQPSHPAAASGQAKKKTPPATRDDQLAVSEQENAGPLLRQEIALKTYPVNQIRFYNGARIKLSPDRRVYLTRDNGGIARAFAAEFETQGISTALIDLSDPIPDLSDAAGIVIIPDMRAAKDGGAAKTFLTRAFELARQGGPSLMEGAKQGGAFFTTVTFSGGAFGFTRPGHDDVLPSPAFPVYGGLAGLAKTADIEWKDVLCHALDLTADHDKCTATAEAAVALMMTHGAVEMGIDGEHCNIPELRKTPIEAANLDLGPEDVVVITGGAKGVTAECALALARNCGAKIALWGRSSVVTDEPGWLTPLTEAGEIKQGILQNEFKDRKPTPADIQKRFQAIISNRAIRANLDRIRTFSSDVAYYAVDIRDRDAVSSAMAAVRKDMGTVTALIHGAGVLEDKLIVEKQPDQFQRVFDTKVEGVENLLAATEKDTVRYTVLFSSVAARFGNQGQCDYAMANEVLNKYAQTLSRTTPGCRFISINWGPWDGGMVDESLKREFSKRGIDLIPLRSGAEQMVMEMANPDRKSIEVVIGAGLKTEPEKKKPVFSKAFDLSLGTSATPVINDHCIDCRPVVPLAMMAELMAHAGMKNNPGLTFFGLDGMRLFKGVLPPDQDISVAVELGRCTPEKGAYTVPARLISETEGRPHAGGTVVLRDRLPEPPVLSKAAFMDLKPAALTPEEAYDRRILFHGPGLQCISGINGISARGIDVTAQCGQGPEDWYAAPHAKQWALDPLMLDAAFQAAIIWTYETRGAVCLPNAWDSLRVYASYPGKAHKEGSRDIRILFTVNHEDDHRIQGYVTFLDADNTVVASIMGFEALTDKNLLEKFRNTPLFDREKILAFAQGNPSEAFGEPYAIFDKDREIARLPRPPYFFMDRVTQADHSQWEMTSGGWIEAEYDIPQDEWYFRANRTQAMPFCILLEIALQPCGWLAAYAGSALQSSERLHFRNLGGKATLIRNPGPQSGTLKMRSRLTDVSKAGGMIIQHFDMEVLNKGRLIYQGTTNFGFFTSEALANQVGIRDSRFLTDLPDADTSRKFTFPMEAPATPDDKTIDENRGMPATALRMIDRIEHLDFEGGLYGQGMVAGAKTVNPEEWFFHAHFYQDPVCPGSLGVESFIQLLRYFLIEKYQIDAREYDVRMAEQQQHEWIYRGQIIPSNKEVSVQAHISSCTSHEGHFSIQASGALTVDGICIYEMDAFSLELVPVSAQSKTPGLLPSASKQESS